MLAQRYTLLGSLVGMRISIRGRHIPSPSTISWYACRIAPTAISIVITDRTSSLFRNSILVPPNLAFTGH